MKEEWKGLQYNGVDYSKWYEVSNLGEIRNVRLKKIRKSINLSKKGYRCSSFTMGNIKDKMTFNYHRAVACTFIPTNDYTLTINHKDGDKLNNTVDNLEWCSNKENMQHAFENNLFKSRQGTKNNSNLLTEDEVRLIRKLYIPRHPEFSGVELAKKFGVHASTIQSIIHRRKWEWLE